MLVKMFIPHFRGKVSVLAASSTLLCGPSNTILAISTKSSIVVHNLVVLVEA